MTEATPCLLIFHTMWNETQSFMSFAKADRDAATIFDLISGPHFLPDWVHALLRTIIQHRQNSLINQSFEENGVGPLFPQQEDVLLTRAQQENYAACKWLTQVCSEEGHILWLQKRPEAHLATNQKMAFQKLLSSGLILQLLWNKPFDDCSHF